MGCLDTIVDGVFFSRLVIASVASKSLPAGAEVRMCVS